MDKKLENTTIYGCENCKSFFSSLDEEEAFKTGLCPLCGCNLEEEDDE